MAKWLLANADPPLEYMLRAFQARWNLIAFLYNLMDGAPLARAGADYEVIRSDRVFYLQYPYLLGSHLVFELESYQSLRAHERGFMAKFLGISVAQEDLAIDMLLRSNRIWMRNGKYHLVNGDTHRRFGNMPGNADLIAGYWARYSSATYDHNGLEAKESRSLLGYRIYNASEDAHNKIKEQTKNFMYQVSEILRQDKEPKSELFALVTHLFPLQDTPTDKPPASVIPKGHLLELPLPEPTCETPAAKRWKCKSKVRSR
jgi:hypothetical protein